MKVLEGIILFLVTCAVALLVWVNWTAIGDKVDNLFHPNSQEQVIDEADTSIDDDIIMEDGMTTIILD